MPRKVKTVIEKFMDLAMSASAEELQMISTLALFRRSGLLNEAAPEKPKRERKPKGEPPNHMN